MSIISSEKITIKAKAVLALLVEGLSNPRIADQQNYSIATVKYNASNVLSRLGPANRKEAVALAIENNLVSKN